MNVEIDADCCGGFGQCVALSAEVFALTDAGYAVVLLSEIPSELEAIVREAEQRCPTHAITVT